MAFNFNDTEVSKVYLDGVEVHKLYFNDELVFETTPIEDADYILYDYDPSDGYETKDDMRRYVVDKGVNLNTGIQGNYPGSLYSGRLLNLSAEQALAIPLGYTVNAAPYLQTLRANEEMIIRPLANGTNPNWYLYPGSVIKITADILEQSPSNTGILISYATQDFNVSERWYISAIDDVVQLSVFPEAGETFDPIEVSGQVPGEEIVIEWSTSNNTIIINGIDTGETISSTVEPTQADCTVGCYTTIPSECESCWNEKHSISVAIHNFEVNGEIFDFEKFYGNPFIIGSKGTRLELISLADPLAMWQGDITFDGNYIIYFDPTTHVHIQEQPQGVTHKIFTDTQVGHIAVLQPGKSFTPEDIVLLNETPELLARLALGDTTTGLSLLPDDIKEYYPVMERGTGQNVVYGIKGGQEEIAGFTEDARQHNSPFGIQPIRFTGQPGSPVPDEFINRNFVNFAGVGDRIDTGVVIDGTVSDFSMVMAFTFDTNDTVQRTIAATAGEDTVDNRVVLRITDANEVQVVFGKNVFDATPSIDPTQPIHAMIANYDMETGELFGAADGGALQSFGTITFDGATQTPVFIGCDNNFTNSHIGDIGRGILAGRQLTEDEWQEFWDEVRICEPEGDELFRNYDFTCNTRYWIPQASTISETNDQLKVVRNASGASARQLVHLTPGTYTLEVNVVSTSSSAFVMVSPVPPEGAYPIDFAPAGIHTADITVEAEDDYLIGPGTNNPVGANSVFEYMSIKRKT